MPSQRLERLERLERPERRTGSVGRVDARHPALPPIRQTTRTRHRGFERRLFVRQGNRLRQVLDAIDRYHDDEAGSSDVHVRAAHGDVKKSTPSSQGASSKYEVDMLQQARTTDIDAVHMLVPRIRTVPLFSPRQPVRMDRPTRTIRSSPSSFSYEYAHPNTPRAMDRETDSIFTEDEPLNVR